MTTAPLAAQDNCPTVADLQTGVVLTDTYGEARTFIQRPDGLYEARIADANTTPSFNWGPHPHPLLPGVRPSAVGALTIRYTRDPVELNNLQPGEMWLSDVSYFLDGAPFATGRAEVFSHQASSLPQQTLGSCTYETRSYRVTLDMQGDNVGRMQGSDHMSDDKNYAPQLGLVISATILDRDSVPRGDQAFVDIARIGQ